jgi:hypothetical protein
VIVIMIVVQMMIQKMFMMKNKIKTEFMKKCLIYITINLEMFLMMEFIRIIVSFFKVFLRMNNIMKNGSLNLKIEVNMT